MKLFLCEKPSQGRDIAKVVGAYKSADGCIRGTGIAVTWCVGHLIETAQPEAYGDQYKKWALETLPICPQKWKVAVKPKLKKQYNIIKKLLGEASEVVIATDADREGEVIAREVMELAGYKGKTSRLWLSALDEASIKEALKKIRPGYKTENLYQAGLARSRADWLVGMNLTRAYSVSSYSKGVLSVGRVQTPTLKLIVDRDRTIEQFVPEPYYNVIVSVAADQTQFDMKWVYGKEHCFDKSKAQEVKNDCKAGTSGTITKCQYERKKQAAPLCYSLSSLQTDASKLYSLDAKKVLDIAQGLYEKHKVTSYPRTDCEYLPTNQQKDVSTILGLMPGEYQGLVSQADPSLKSRVWNDKKITAHHAIIPTKLKANLDQLSVNEKKLYDLIVRRYLAQFFPLHEYDQTIIDAQMAGHLLRASGRVSIKEGWKAVLVTQKKEKEEGEALPQLAEGDHIVSLKSQLKTQKTKPPQHFTSGTLITAMKNIAKEVEDPRLKKILKESSGIGTEATRANIIDTLFQRKYIEKHKRKYFISTDIGRKLIDVVAPMVSNPATTAVWEQVLEEIANGNVKLDQFMKKQEAFVTQIVESMK